VKKILTALVVSTGLLLTGCSNVDAALTIGDTKITTAELQANADIVLAERTKVDTSQMQLETGEVFLRNQLNFQLLLVGFSEIAKELDIPVTLSEIAGRRAEIVQQVGGAEALPGALVSASMAPEDFDGYIRAMLVTQKLSQALVQAGFPEADAQTRVQELFVKKVNTLKVEVNPRYGKWDETTGQIVAADAAGGVVTPSNE
jgi:hypothetical protein